MAPAEKRSHPRQRSHDSVDEDKAILAAAVELQPYAAPASQSRSRWQIVAEWAIAETGLDEISGSQCKRRYESLLEIARNVSEEEWNQASGDETLKDLMKQALAKHCEWEASTKSPRELDQEEERTVPQQTSPVSPESRYPTRGSTSATSAPVVSPQSNPQRKPTQRELLSRVTSVRQRERKRMKTTKIQSTTTAPVSVVLSSFVAELNETSEESLGPPCASAAESVAKEEPPTVPPPGDATSSQVEAPTTAQPDEHDSISPCTDIVEETPTHEGEAWESAGEAPAPIKPPVVSEPSKPARRSFIANVFDSWFKRKVVEPTEEAAQTEQGASDRCEREQPPAQASDVPAAKHWLWPTACEDQVGDVARTVTSPMATISATETEVKDIEFQTVPLAATVQGTDEASGQEIDRATQAHEPRQVDEQSFERRLSTNAAAHEDCHAKLNDVMKVQQQQQQRLEAAEQKISMLAASLSEFQEATNKLIQQNHLQALKLHTQTQLELSQLSKTLTEHRSSDTLALLQQIQKLEATATTTKGNEV